ncbi:MAG: hypothetical protein WCL54_03285 [Clostridia bacterium]
MKSVVLYFTRTGNTKRIAQKISDRAGAELVEITDGKNWKGIFGFIKGGFYSSTWRTTEAITSPIVDLSLFDKVVIVSPMWASNVAPAVFSLLMKEITHIKQLHLVIKSEGAPAEASFFKLEEKVGKLDYKYSIVTRQDNEERVVNELVNALQE